MLVLVGFLCLQFHSFSHIDLELFSDYGKLHQIENSFSPIDEHPTSDEHDIVSCPDCVLTKHIQAGINQNVVLQSNNWIQVIDVPHGEHVIEFSDHLFQLRAPPVYAV